jgi:hypothetical protein
MKTVLDKSTRDELVVRIRLLTEESTAQWGKMNIYQMLKHCTLAEEMYLGIKIYKRTFMGWLFGKTAIKNMLKDETPISRNAPTSHHFKVSETHGDFAAEKKKWMELIEAYADYAKPDFVHWFFGKMTREQVGLFAYKHADHHLCQFNV